MKTTFAEGISYFLLYSFENVLKFGHSYTITQFALADELGRQEESKGLPGTTRHWWSGAIMVGKYVEGYRRERGVKGFMSYGERWI